MENDWRENYHLVWKELRENVRRRWDCAGEILQLKKELDSVNNLSRKRKMEIEKAIEDKALEANRLYHGARDPFLEMFIFTHTKADDL